MGFSRLFYELKSPLFFKITRNITDNSPAISFGMWALVRDAKDKKPPKIMIFRARTTDPGPRGEREQPVRPENPKHVTGYSW